MTTELQESWYAEVAAVFGSEVAETKPVQGGDISEVLHVRLEERSSFVLLGWCAAAVVVGRVLDSELVNLRAVEVQKAAEVLHEVLNQSLRNI